MSCRQAIAALAVGAVLVLGGTVCADEGMWVFNNVPIQQIEAKHGFYIPFGWLDHLRSAAVRFNSGGSGAFVSADGLVLTNHHVGADMLQKISTAEKDYYKDGFLAKTRGEELKAPDLELNVLVAIEDVTRKVNAAVKKGMDDGAAVLARRGAMATIEKESLEKTGLRSDVVTLHQGAQFHLYTYRKYTDVRLVFAPEFDIAFFGGDPDNFEYPRYDLDVCFFRAYKNGKPARPDHYLKWSSDGSKDGELVFVAGHPGRTSRLFTMAHLEYLRDYSYPFSLDMLQDREAFLLDYGQKGAEQARQSKEDLFGYQNSRKARNGGLEGLRDPALMSRKAKAERALRARVEAAASRRILPDPIAEREAADRLAAEKKAAAGVKDLPKQKDDDGPAAKKKAEEKKQAEAKEKADEKAEARKQEEKKPEAYRNTGLTAANIRDLAAARSAWERIAQAQQVAMQIRLRLNFLENGIAFDSRLFAIARTLVRLADEKARPNPERLREYRDSALESLQLELFSDAPIYPEYEKAKLAHSLAYWKQQAGDSDEMVERVLRGRTPEQAAAELVDGTKLADVAVRKELAGQAPESIATRDDAMIKLALAVDADARAVRKRFEDEIEAVYTAQYARISRAIFADQKDAAYPDATFTLRLSVGKVKGYAVDDEEIAPYTTIGGAFAHAQAHGNTPPYKLPPSWIKAKDQRRLRLNTPLNFVSTADIIGGNSGSPVVNRRNELVGLIFDGNIQSLVLDFLYDDRAVRAVSVDSRAIIEALRSVYEATALVKELTGQP